MRPRIPTPDGVPFIGLTGGIGAGKSTALAALRELGCSTLSADEAVHEIQRQPDVVASLVARFGDSVAPAGEVDRAALAAAAFADPESRKWLEELIWPRVGARIIEWRVEQESLDPPPRAAVVEVPLLFESGMDAAFSATVAVVADEEVRARRAAERGHVAVDERTARQLPQSEKAARSTVTVRNDGSLSQLRDALSSALGTIGV